MKPPAFVKVVNGIWTLKGDQWIRPYVESTGRLDWDAVYLPILPFIKGSSGTVIDAGAFIGDSTIWFNDHPCVTFEPQRDAFVCLCHNLPKQTHYPFPVGNGEVVALQYGEGGNMGARVCNQGEMVRTMRIDDLAIENVCCIKIDVEGWEPNVLKGAKETIQRCKPVVMVEFNKPALDRAKFTYEDIAGFFKGWKSRELFRCGAEQWDALYFP